MFKSAIRVNKITSIAQLRGATLHAERGDETSKSRLREGAEPGAGLAWSKGVKDRDYLAAFKAHKAELGAKERKGAPIAMQALCVVSPEWVKTAGDLHDPNNPHNRALFAHAKAWAESWAGKRAVFGARLDLDEAGGAVVDLMIAPVRDSRGKPVISTQKALVELKAATGERNEYSALQTSWADWAREHLDAQIERGLRKEISKRQHLSPETYGLVKDQTRTELVQERGNAADLMETIRSASELPTEALDDLRGYLLLQREMRAHKRDPRGYEAPQDDTWQLDERLEERLAWTENAWPAIDAIRKDAQEVLIAANTFGMGMDDDKGGYEAGRSFFPALADRMHLTAVIAKCADFCAKAEAFVKNTIDRIQGREETHQDHHRLWPFDAADAVDRNERNLGLRPPEVVQAVKRERSTPPQQETWPVEEEIPALQPENSHPAERDDVPAPDFSQPISHTRDLDDDWDL